MLSFPKIAYPVLVASAAVSLGCTGEVVDGADADTSTTHALLVVEQSALPEEAAATRSHASVWFLRVADQQDLEAATELVTDRLELPSPGDCVAVSGNEPAPPADMAPVDLAFAGDVRMRTGEEDTPLTLRFFPDVANLVSGVMYTLQDQDDLEIPFGPLVSIHASGTPVFEPLEASAPTPPLPRGVALDGQPIADGTVEVPRGRPVSLTWTPGLDEDVVFVDVEPVPAAPSERVRCAFMDRGAGEIPMVAIPESAKMNLTFHRFRNVPLRDEEGNVGNAHFDLTVSAQVLVGNR